MIQDPQSKFCPRHSESPSTDTSNFAGLLAEHAEDFQTAEGINHSLAALYKLLASGQISPRRATGLAYIASLLLRTLPDIREEAVEGRNFSQSAPARGCVGLSPDEKPPTLPELTSPEEEWATRPEKSGGKSGDPGSYPNCEPWAPAPPAQINLPRQASPLQSGDR